MYLCNLFEKKKSLSVTFPEIPSSLGKIVAEQDVERYSNLILAEWNNLCILSAV